MKQEIISTATGEVEGYKDLLSGESKEPQGESFPDVQPYTGSQGGTPPGPTENEESIQQSQNPEVQNYSFGSDFFDYSTVDKEHIGAIFPDEAAIHNNVMAADQGFGSTLFNAFAAGATTGVVSAATPFLNGIAFVVGAMDEEYANNIRGIDDSINESFQDYFKYHESDLSQDAGFGEEFLRFSTLESLTKSVTQFAVLGAISGGIAAKVGSMALRYGTTVSGVSRASKLAQSLSTKLGTGLTEKIPLGLGINSNALGQGLISNMFEGAVMADEVGSQMLRDYAPALYDPNTTPEMADKIKSEISDAKSNIRLLNTFFAVNNVVGYSAMAGAFNKKVLSTQLFKKMRVKSLGVVSLSEGLEENMQSVLQAGATDDSARDIERAYAQEQTKTKGVPLNDIDNAKTYKAEDALLWEIDPEKAEQLAMANASSVGEYLQDHATSRQALIETASGVIGGGPQWLLTTAPGKLKNYKANRQRLDDQVKGFSTTEDLLLETQKGNLKNSIALASTLKNLEQLVPDDADDAYLKEVVKEYLITDQVLSSLLTNTEEQLGEFLAEEKYKAKESLSSGDMTKAEYDSIDDRIKYTESLLSKYAKFGAYATKHELLSNTLEEASVLASIKAIEKAEARKKTTSAPKAAPKDAAKPEDLLEQNNKEIADIEGKVATLQSEVEELTKDPESMTTEMKESVAKKEQALAQHNTRLTELSPKAKEKLNSPDNTIDKPIVLTDPVKSDGLSESNKEDIPELIDILKFKVKHAQDKENANKDNPKVLAKIKAKNKKNKEDLAYLEATYSGTEEVVEVADTAEEQSTQGGNTEVTGSIEEKTTLEGDSSTPVTKEQLQERLHQLGIKSTYLQSIPGRAQAHKRTLDQAKLWSSYGPYLKSKSINKLDEGIRRATSSIENAKGKEASRFSEILRALLQRKSVVETLEKTNSKNVREEAKKGEAVSKKHVADDVTPEFSGEGDEFSEYSTDDDEPGTSVVEEVPIVNVPEEVQDTPESIPSEGNSTQAGKNILAFDPETGMVIQSDASKKKSHNDMVQKASKMASKDMSAQDKAKAGQNVEKAGKDASTKMHSQEVPSVPDINDNSNVSFQSGNIHLAFLSNFLNAYEALSEGTPSEGGYPTVDESTAVMMQLPGVTREHALSFVKSVYAAMQNVPMSEIAHSGKKQVSKVNTEDDSNEVQQDDTKDNSLLTVKSFALSGDSIAWTRNDEGKPIANFLKIKKGTKLNYRVVPLSELEGSTELSITIGGFDGELEESLTYDEFIVRRDVAEKSGNKEHHLNKFSSYYKTSSIRPIEVSAEGVVLGVVHTSTWAKRRESSINEQGINAARKAVYKLRYSVLKGYKEGRTVTGKVTGRKDNIHNVGGQIIGTAVRVVKNLYKGLFEEKESKNPFTTTGEVLGNDPRVKYAIVTEEGRIQNDMEEVLHKEYAKSGKDPANSIAVPKHYQVGSLVALIPVEDTGMYQAVKLVTNRVSDEHLDSLTRLMNRLEQGAYKYSPGSVYAIFNSIVNANYTVGEHGSPTSTKFNVAVDNGNEDTSPTLSISMMLKDSSIDLVFDVERTPIGNNKYTYKYKLKTSTSTFNGTTKESSTLADMRSTLAGIRSTEESRPYIHIGASKLFDAQEGSKKPTKVLGSSVSYMKDFVLKNSKTNLDPSWVDGAPNYHTNTIVTVDTGDTEVDLKKVENKGRAEEILSKEEKEYRDFADHIYRLGEAMKVFLSTHKNTKSSAKRDEAFLEFVEENTTLELTAEILDELMDTFGITVLRNVVTKGRIKEIMASGDTWTLKADEIHNKPVRKNIVFKGFGDFRSLFKKALDEKELKGEDEIEEGAPKPKKVSKKKSTFEPTQSVNTVLNNALKILESFQVIERIDDLGKPCKD